MNPFVVLFVLFTALSAGAAEKIVIWKPLPLWDLKQMERVGVLAGASFFLVETVA
jgi:hypothetical protein